jgi:hypothetical protein
VSHGRSCAGPRTREVGKHLGEVAVSYGEGDTDPRNCRVSFDKVASQLGFRCDHTVQDYLAWLVPAEQAGIYPDVTGNGRYGNYTVWHLEPPGRSGRCAAPLGRPARWPSGPGSAGGSAVGLPREFWTSELSLITGWVQRRQHIAVLAPLQRSCPGVELTAGVATRHARMCSSGAGALCRA